MFQAEIFDKMTLHAKKSLNEAAALAAHYHSSQVKPIHLLLAIYLEEGSLGANMLKDAGVRKTHFNQILPKKNSKSINKSVATIRPGLSKNLRVLITDAFSLASDLNYPYIGTEHLIHVLLESNDLEIKKIWQNKSLSQKSLQNLKNLLSALPFDESPLDFSASMQFPQMKIPTKPETNSSSLNFLQQFCSNLNQQITKSKETLSGRQEELERLIHILGRKTKNNPLLIGQPGVGKTALVLALAQKINSGQVPAYLADKIIFSLDIALVVAGTTFRGEFENRLKEIINQASQNPNVILFIDELHIIVGAGNTQGGLDAANILKPALSSGQIQCIGATTYGEYKKYIEKDSALARRFQTIKLAEPSVEQAKEMLRKIKSQYEKFHHLSISDQAIDSAVELSSRYINDRFLPDKAIDILDESAAVLKNHSVSFEQTKQIQSFKLQIKKSLKEKEALTQNQQYEQALLQQEKEKELLEQVAGLKKKIEQENDNSLILTEKDIIETIARITRIPKEKIAINQDRRQIKNIETKMGRSIIGQEKAIRTISDVLLRSFSGITNPDKPIGSFLFLGPSGSGKTLTAKILAQEIFSDNNSIIKIDMSEFSEKHTVARLVGAPAGYIGFGEGGTLTERVRHNPYSLILFDEVEKAHPEILNILLQILEDGFLTDAEGQRVDFRNTIIILTSNVGTLELTQGARLGFFEKENPDSKQQSQLNHLKSDVIKKISHYLKPEILNRLDHLIIFEALSEKDILKIVDLQIGNLIQRLKKQGLSLKVAASLKKFLAQKSHVAEYGGRLVGKNIQDILELEIARFILENPHKKTISLDLKKDKVIAK